MRYDISKPSALKMIALGRVTESIKILLEATLADSRDQHLQTPEVAMVVVAARVSTRAKAQKRRAFSVGGARFSFV